MADLNLNELRKVAEAATPGPWEVQHREGLDWLSSSPHINSGDHEPGSTVRRAGAGDSAWGSTWPHRNARADATHIATFDPPTVLALLDRVAELEAVVGRVEALCAGAWWTGEVHRDDIRAALRGESDE